MVFLLSVTIYFVGLVLVSLAHQPFEHCSCKTNVLSCRRQISSFYSYSHRSRYNRTRYIRDSPNETPYIDVQGICPNATEVLIGGLDLDNFPDGIDDRVTKIVASSNNFLSLPNVGQLSNNTKYLDLSANRITIERDNEKLRMLKSLEELRLGWNRVNHLGFLPDPCNLLHLDLTVNYIIDLEDSLRRCTYLEYFRILANNVTSLPDGGFIGLSKLRDLTLTSNPIEIITNRSFDGLPSLENLALSTTLLTTLPNRAFSVLQSLRQLTLSHNDFENLPSRAFEGLSKLNLLDLSYSLQNATLPEDIFSDLHNLEELNLAYNNQTSFPINIFSGLSNLRKLFLDNNELTTIHQNIFRDLVNLEALHLQRNKIEYIPEGAFSTLGNLKVLLLGENELRVLPGSLFTNTHSLEELNVVGNYLTSLPELRNCCEWLRTASFRKNSVAVPTEVALRALLGNGGERTVDLKDNPIRASSLRWILRAEDVTTSDNYCTCGELRKGDAKIMLCLDTPCVRKPGFRSWVAYVRAANGDLRLDG